MEMAYFKFGALDNEFRAVPETGRGLYGEQIGNGGHDEAQPACGKVAVSTGIYLGKVGNGVTKLIVR